MTFTHSIRFKFILFVLAILAVLLLLLNTYPITSSRDTVFQEKQSSLSSQITVVSSALGSLDQLSQNGVNDVLRFLDLSGFDRIVVVDERGSVVFDDGQDAPDLQDLQTALTGKSVFRSVFADAAFSSSIAVPVGSRGAMIGAVSLSEVDTERAAIILSIQNRIVFLSLSIGLAALLLEGHDLPGLVRERFRDAGVRPDTPDPVRPDLAVGIGGRVALSVHPMLFQEASAYVHVAYYDHMAVGKRDVVEILLDGIFAVTVRYAQDPQGVGGADGG